MPALVERKPLEQSEAEVVQDHRPVRVPGPGERCGVFKGGQRDRQMFLRSRRAVTPVGCRAIRY
jgi:hypothetical protein